MGKKTEQCSVLLFFLSGLVQCTTALIVWTALVDVSYFDSKINSTVNRYCECGVYGRNSPLVGTSGIVTLPTHDPEGCGQDVLYSRNATSPPWIAMVKRGNCTFSEKIMAAKRQGAVGVVIYNADDTGNRTDPMAHSEVMDIVAIMIGNGHGTDIVSLVKSGVEVKMVIELGSASGLWIESYWLYFLSISFFIVTAASILYFVFISAHRIHSIRMQKSAERKLKLEAKNAIGQLQVCTLKKGDPQVGSDSYMCAVCIDSYKAGDVVTVLTCGHIFHKSCIEPWLLEKRTCPMCKCDILKALGVEEETRDESTFMSSPAEETVVTVSGGGSMYEVPLTDSTAPAPGRNQHRYDNRGFEGDSPFATA